jgi:hypothetical protein
MKWMQQKWPKQDHKTTNKDDTATRMNEVVRRRGYATWGLGISMRTVNYVKYSFDDNARLTELIKFKQHFTTYR